jgi:hypothetical protein
MSDAALWEIYRSGWRRERERLGLLDTRQEDFATGGLGQYVPNLTVRLVILPADPERRLIEFDKEFWEWWKTGQGSPFGEPLEDWSRGIPTTNAAVGRQSLSSDRWKWDSYYALYRHGGGDMGLGRDGGRLVNDGKPLFFLLRIVGRVWTALHMYETAVVRYKINGPWECSVAILRTLEGRLGDFATGWLDTTDPDENPYRCPEPNLCGRWELEDWPSPEQTQDFAFKIGGWIENSWGMQSRRFIARSGPLEGRFDTSHYQ